MSQKEDFLEMLNEGFDFYCSQKENKTNVLLEEKDGFDFDVDAAFAEWANSVGVDYLIVNVAEATQNDIAEIEAHWNRPTAYFFKDYGTEDAGNYRNKISFFIKDRNLGFFSSGDAEPQVVLCVASVLKNKPIKDFYESQSFFSTYSF